MHVALTASWELRSTRLSLRCSARYDQADDERHRAALNAMFPGMAALI
jgi:hypothetical protein